MNMLHNLLLTFMLDWISTKENMIFFSIQQLFITVLFFLGLCKSIVECGIFFRVDNSSLMFFFHYWMVGSLE